VSNKKAGQINGNEFTVVGLKNHQLIVANEKGTHTLDTHQPLGMDYALVSTAYRAQGQTAKRVIVSATDSFTSAQEPFYVKISRQTHEIHVYAQDVERLQQWVQQSVAQENPLNLVEEHYGKRSLSSIPSDLYLEPASGIDRSAKPAPIDREQDFTEFGESTAEQVILEHQRYSFEGLDRLAAAVASQQAEREVASHLRDISQSISDLYQTVDRSLQRQRVDAIAEGIKQWRSEQAIAETILNHRYEGMNELVDRLQASQHQRLLSRSGLDIQMTALAQMIQRGIEQPTLHQFEAIQKLLTWQ
jgi:hypothetical protein